MASMPLALSVHNFINSVGADAGFASVVGLAILVLLYFAHARETANLRDEAAALSRRLEEAEARLAQAQSAQEVAGPGAAVEPAPPAARIPAAPAGVAAPALATATRFIPVRAPQSAVAAAAGAPVSATVSPGSAPVGASVARASQASGASPAPAPARAGSAAPAPAAGPGPFPTASPQPAASAPPAGAPSAVPKAPPAAAPSAVPAAPSPDAPVPAAPPAPAFASGSPQAAPVAGAQMAGFSRPAPATVAGGANGAAHASPTGVAEPPPPISLPGGPVRAEGVAPIRRPGTRADFPRAPGLSPGTRGRDGRAWRRFGLVMGALVVVAAAAAVVILTTGTGTQRPSSTAPASNAPIPGGGFKPSHVTVAVLNGTATNQLAHHVAAGLATKGYKEGRIATASNQTLTHTEVAYLPGRANRTAALHVARALHLRPAAVMPIDQAARAVACPPPGTCTANVVVTVGSDLAQS